MRTTATTTAIDIHRQLFQLVSNKLGIRHDIHNNRRIETHYILSRQHVRGLC